jgi:hypothetical protein
MLANVKPADIRGHTVARHQPAVDIRHPQDPGSGLSRITRQRAYPNVDRAIIFSR